MEAFLPVAFEPLNFVDLHIGRYALKDCETKIVRVTLSKQSVATVS